ncbi:hypothetical protein DWH33_002459 [Escherichia coli]|nr:hypothetical protein [Escherichia coli]
MKKHLLPLALLFSGISPAQALDVGDISSFMNSDSSTLSKTIKNSTDSDRLINIRLERLSSPLDDGQVISMDKPDELLLTPASLLLPAQANPAANHRRQWILWRDGDQRRREVDARHVVRRVLPVSATNARRQQLYNDHQCLPDLCEL